MPKAALQADLFESAPGLPQGMRYRADVLTPREERDLLAMLPALPLRAFEFRGFLGKRRTVSFGWRYDFNGGGLGKSAPIPDFLLPARERAAAFAALAPEALEHALIIEYQAGAGIGWHRDRPAFGDVIGLSLGSECTFRLRRSRGPTWERRSLVATPRSAYLLRGPSRTEWEHSIPPLETLRYSVTFRTLASADPARARSVPSAAE